MNFSLEITMKTDLSILPKVKDIYITFLPGNDFKEVAEKAKELVKSGFNAVPHFPARSIKNLKEKLMKVNEYIEEETQGIQSLTNKRSSVEREADEVTSLITSLRDKLAGIDRIVDDEGSRIKSFKESRSKTSNF